MSRPPGPIFGGTEGFESRFLVLRSRTRFRRYRQRPVPFSCFALPNSFSAVLRASSPAFMFCAPEPVFGDTGDVGSIFAFPDSFSAVPRALGPVFMCFAPGRVRRYRQRRVPFSCFAHPDSFSAKSKALGPVFKFCAQGHNFGRTEGVRSRFNGLRSRTHVRRYRWRRLPFSCFALPESFSVPSLVFMFCAPEPVFGGTECVGSRFHVLRPRFIFDSIDGVGYYFHVLRSRTHFQRY
jgi:hypothetical protein